MQYLSRLKMFSIERVMKSLVGELTENEKWSIKGTLMGECWHRDCCVSDYKDHKRCGKSEFGNQKVTALILPEVVHQILKTL